MSFLYTFLKYKFFFNFRKKCYFLKFFEKYFFGVFSYTFLIKTGCFLQCFTKKKIRITFPTFFIEYYTREQNHNIRKP